MALEEHLARVERPSLLAALGALCLLSLRFQQLWLL